MDDYKIQNSLTINTAPLVRRHTNILTFLGDYFKYRKNEDNDFTYEEWSKELGFQGLASMYLICKGQRNFTVDTAKKMIPFLNLSELEKKHILLLANYSQSQSVEVRSALFDKILANLEFSEVRLVAKKYKKFITSKTMPLVRMILSYDNAAGTEAEILQILDISKKQLKCDLNALVEMELIQKIQLESNGETVWRPLAKSIKFPETSMEDIVDLFYVQNLNETKEILKQQSIYKKMRSLILAIDPAEYTLLEDEIEDFASRLKNRFCGNDLTSKHILKFHMQAYQVSRVKV